MNSITKKTETLFDKKGKVQGILEDVSLLEWEISENKKEFTAQHGNLNIKIEKTTVWGKEAYFLDIEGDIRLLKGTCLISEAEGKYLKKYTNEIISMEEAFQ